MNLLGLVRQAQESGDDGEMALFRATASHDTLRAAYVLAASMGRTPADLRTLLSQLWDDVDPSQAVDGLADWPLVEQGPDEWRIGASFARALLDEFRRSEDAAWQSAHRLLVDLELRSVSTTDDSQRWFAQARAAVYCAGFDPVESVQQLGRVFTDPPHSNPDVARRWLTTLVLLHDGDLTARPREHAFFLAYDIYSVGVATQALEQLGQFIHDPTADPYSAFALYLAGVLRGLSRAESGLYLLRNSIELSETLGLVEPEIRARHSYVWTLIGGLGQNETRASVSETLQRAKASAHLNLRRAEEYGSPLLVARSTWTATVADWLVLVDRAPNDGQLLTYEGLKAVKRLERTREELFDHGDPRAAVVSIRDAMNILGDLGRIDEALGQADAAVNLAASFEAPASLGRVETAAKTLLERADAYQSQRIHSLLGELRALSGSRQ